MSDMGITPHRRQHRTTAARPSKSILRLRSIAVAVALLGASGGVADLLRPEDGRVSSDGLVHGALTVAPAGDLGPDHVGVGAVAAAPAVPVAVELEEPATTITVASPPQAGEDATGPSPDRGDEGTQVSAHPTVIQRDDSTSRSPSALSAGTYHEVSDNAASFDWPGGSSSSSLLLVRGDAAGLDFFVYVQCVPDGPCQVRADLTNPTGSTMHWPSGLLVTVTISRAGEVVQAVDLSAPGVVGLASGESHTLEQQIEISEAGHYDVSGATDFEVR